jgi:replicative DNA helicase
MSRIDEEDLGPPPGSPDELRSVAGLFDEALRRSKARRDGKEKPVPLPWKDLSEQFGGGLWPGVHVLVGGTGAGKSTWAIQTAMHAAKIDVPVGYIGLELEDMQIALRLLADEAKIAWSKLYLGKASPNELGAARDAKERLAALPFYVEVGRPNGWPISELEKFISKMREHHPEKEPGSLPMLVVLDFLQIVGDETTEKGRAMGLDLRERIGRAAYAARDAARRHNVAVILVSSTARDNYETVAGEKLTGLKAEMVETEGDGATKVKRVKRSIAGADRFVGLGKESGEVEYSADSVTVAIRTPVEREPKKTSFVFITAKGRATGPGWSELRFNGFRFNEPTDGGIGLAEELGAMSKPSKTKGKAKSKDSEEVSDNDIR